MTMRYHYRRIRMAIIKKANHIKCWQGYEGTGGNIKWYNYFGKQLGSS